jgi:nucleoside 2-deoxyribosyltransferase
MSKKPRLENRNCRLVYIAGSIDGITREEAQNWRTEVYDFLSGIGVCSLVPGLEKTKLTSSQIVNLDFNMIDLCDTILVNLDFLTKEKKKWVGTGTLIELGIGLSKEKRIIAFTMGEKLSDNFLFLNGSYDHLFYSMQEALNKIKEINNIEGKFISGPQRANI